MKSSDKVENILKSHNLKITGGRIDVLEFFLNQNRTLSFKDLEEKFKGSDRVTLYRTLKSFTEQGILHKVPDDSGHASYGLCHDTCNTEEHNHDHIHFKCSTCGNIECLDESIPVVKVPGYHIEESNLILKGTCKSCAA